MIGVIIGDNLYVFLTFKVMLPGTLVILDVATFFFCTFSSYQRLRNAWHNIRHVEPDSINPLQIQEKYGFDWKYQEYILGPCEDDEQDSTPAPELAPTDEVQDLSEKIIEQNREAYDSLASSDKERPE